MPQLKAITRKKLISCLKKFGFDVPYSGGKHQFFVLFLIISQKLIFKK